MTAIAIVALLTVLTPASANPVVQTDQIPLDKARSVVASLRLITSDRGIEERKQVRLGGVDQWITVRGRDRGNPILLFIHGGPGVPEMPGSWFYQSPWEDYFTVVQWDQRGSGRSLTGTDPVMQAKTITLDRMVTDAVELVGYLRATYGKRKIFVLGHSWGSVVGARLAHRRPQWLHAYIGMGQAVYFTENERLGTDFVLRRAREAGNVEAQRELEAILPYPEPGRPVQVEKIVVQRKWLTYFGGMTWNRRDLRFQEDAAQLSPDYTDADLAARDGSIHSVIALLPALSGLRSDDVKRIDCPVFVLAGEHDHATSGILAERWLARLRAPAKRFISFPGVAHEIQFEAPGRLLVHLVRDVRPLAVRAHDGEWLD